MQGKGTTTAAAATLGALALAPWALASGPHDVRTGLPLGPLETASAAESEIGRFGAPFSEPTVGVEQSDAFCITDQDGVQICKPAAGSMSVLPDGKVLYWNALEGTENVQASIVAEFGEVSVNDQTRVVDLLAREWTRPEPNDGGANPGGYDGDPASPASEDHDPSNDGALFCADLNFLPDGRVLAVGGTVYYADPNIPGTDYGVVELEGLRNSRIYDPETNTWEQTGSMTTGRWYPTIVTLADGDQLVASGVKRLLKPVYTDEPTTSGTNVRSTETYDVATGEWTVNGAAAEKSLPLYPRLHLLPNGRVYYNAAGQSFNPAGQSYDEATWNVASVYDPASKSWRDLGVPGMGAVDPTTVDPAATARDLQAVGIPGGGDAATIPGFRGSTSSIMLPLVPDAQGRYTEAEFLTAGGVLNPPSPGSYVPTSDSRIDTVDVGGATETLTSRPTGDLNRPRWYGTSILLPTGEVVVFSGGDRDHVVNPGWEAPIRQAELFDPATERWTPIASATQPRTYHNTASLLTDGTVLVGGHAPITTSYLFHQTIPGMAPNEGRDPTFEIFEPPYLFRGSRPRIDDLSTRRPRAGDELEIEVAGDAREIDRVVLVRDASATHTIDGDQRSVVLEVVDRDDDELEVRIPGPEVVPPGPYTLFVNRDRGQGLVPSRGEAVLVR